MNYFVTGIDTDIGKTFITKNLADAFRKSGRKTGVYKPLQSGAVRTENGLLAPDIESVKKLSNLIKTKYSYLLEGEVSPALAARISGVNIDIKKIKFDYEEFSKENDVTLVEGAGGLLAPVTDKMLCADLIKVLKIPIIIVTVPFLGRLNHTFLTVHYAKTEGIQIKGIIINRIPKNTNDEAVINFKNELEMYTDVPVLGNITESNIFNDNEEEFKRILKKI